MSTHSIEFVNNYAAGAVRNVPTCTYPLGLRIRHVREWFGEICPRPLNKSHGTKYSSSLLANLCRDETYIQTGWAFFCCPAFDSHSPAPILVVTSKC